MMHDVLACRHIKPVARLDVSETEQVTDTHRRVFAPIWTTDDHEVGTTESRRLRRSGDFLAAAEFMVGAGFHEKAGRTTLRLAKVFAARMHRNKDGHIPFNVDATAHELGLKRRAVFAHARYLRELGLLAYVEHGTKTNVLRTRYGAAWTTGHGYRGTATLFAPVAPRVWDQAMGHRIEGTGYTARLIGVTAEGRIQAVDNARRQAAAKNSRRRSCTPSVGVPPDGSPLKLVGGNKNTQRKRTTCPKSPSRTPAGHKAIAPAECAQNIKIAERLQREVWWLRRGCPRRLAYALRPLISAGWAWQSLAPELLTWGVPGHLRDPAAYVRHELTRRQQQGHWAHLVVPALRDDQVDDRGERHAEMLRQRKETSEPTWRRYSELLRPQLRRRLAEGRQAHRNQRAAASYRPMWREPEADFLASLPDQSWGNAPVPREIYAARAWGRRPEVVADTTPVTDQGWLEELRDQAEAERACSVLRAELENWAAERG
ncbi:hypothetical protein ACWD4T_00505 [Streptomyces umbrinus]